MSDSVLIATGAVEVVRTSQIVDVNGNPLTGLTNIVLAVVRDSDGKLLDFSNNTFTSSPSTAYATLTQLDATHFPGVYTYSLNTGAFVSPNAGDNYKIYVSQQGGTNAANALQSGELRVSLVDTVTTNLNATVGSRAAPGALMGLVSGAVTSGTLSSGALTSAAFASGALTSAAFASGALTSAAFASGALTSSAFASGALTSSAFASGAITSVAFASGAIASTAFASGALTSTALASSAVTAIQAGLATAAGVTSATSSLATSSALSAVEAGVTAVQGTGFTPGQDNLHSISAAVAASSSSLASSSALSAVAAGIAAIQGTGFTPGQDNLHSLHGLVVAVPAAVWATTEGGTAGTVLYDLTLARKFITNKMAETGGDPGTVVLYDDDAATPLKTWTLLDGTGGAVTPSAGEPALRGAAT